MEKEEINVEMTGILIGAKVARGVLTVFLDVFDDPSKPAQRKRFKVRNGRISQNYLNEFIGKAVVATIIGGYLDDVWPQ